MRAPTATPRRDGRRQPVTDESDSEASKRAGSERAAEEGATPERSAPELAGTERRLHGVLLSVAYDGSRFSGFARQPTARTIAGELDGAVRAFAPRASLVRGASRTDAGVHARDQRVAFDVDRELPARAWVHALNRELPDEIVVRRAANVAPGFEPRFSARRKTYRYVILESVVRSPFAHARAWRVTDRLNHELMREAAAPLVGEHDFRAFRAAEDQRENTVRRLFRIEVRTRSSDDGDLTEIIVEGNGFLHRMVRIVVGSLVDVGVGRLESRALAAALLEKNRAALGRTAPPEGLYLDTIVMDDDGREPWP
jgi:tRNA pseudouridine38-40 synthase